jgi:hypothetical protein
MIVFLKGTACQAQSNIRRAVLLGGEKRKKKPEEKESHCHVPLKTTFRAKNACGSVGVRGGGGR